MNSVESSVQVEAVSTKTNVADRILIALKVHKDAIAEKQSKIWVTDNEAIKDARTQEIFRNRALYEVYENLFLFVNQDVLLTDDQWDYVKCLVEAVHQPPASFWDIKSRILRIISLINCIH